MYVFLRINNSIVIFYVRTSILEYTIGKVNNYCS